MDLSLSFEEIALLRKGTVRYATNCKERRQDMRLDDGLLLFLTIAARKQITQETLKEIFYYEPNQELDEILLMENPVDILKQYILEEDISLERIGTFAGKPVSGMTSEEIKKTMIKMFEMTNEEYKEISRQTGVKLDEIKREHGQDIDSIILAGLLRAKGSDEAAYSGIFGLHDLSHEELPTQEGNLETPPVPGSQPKERYMTTAAYLAAILTMSTAALGALEFFKSIDNNNTGALEGSPYRKADMVLIPLNREADTIPPDSLIQYPSDFAIPALGTGFVTPEKSLEDNIPDSTKVVKRDILNVDTFLDSLVEKTIKKWQEDDARKGRKLIENVIAWVSRTSAFSDIIQEAADERELPYNFLFAKNAWESHGYLRVESPTGPGGLPQLAKSTAKMRGLKRNKFIDERFDPEKAVPVGAFMVYNAMIRYGTELTFVIIADYLLGDKRMKEGIKANGGKVNEDLFYVLDKLFPKEDVAEHYRGIMAIKKLLDDPKYGFSYKQRPSYRKLIADAKEHIVRPRETFEKIREMYGITSGHFKYINPTIRNYNVILVGHKMRR